MRASYQRGPGKGALERESAMLSLTDNGCEGPHGPPELQDSRLLFNGHTLSQIAWLIDVAA